MYSFMSFALWCYFLLGLYFHEGCFSYFIFLDWDVISVDAVSLVVAFLFDWMTLFFMGCVLFISYMVTI